MHRTRRRKKKKKDQKEKKKKYKTEEEEQVTGRGYAARSCRWRGASGKTVWWPSGGALYHPELHMTHITPQSKCAVSGGTNPVGTGNHTRRPGWCKSKGGHRFKSIHQETESFDTCVLGWVFGDGSQEVSEGFLNLHLQSFMQALQILQTTAHLLKFCRICHSTTQHCAVPRFARSTA